MDVLHLPQGTDQGQYIINEQYSNIPIFGDGMPDGLPLMPFVPSYDVDTFSTTFDDPLSYQSSMPFGSYLENDATDLNSESGPPDLDNKLLGFGPPLHKVTILDQNGQTWPRLAAELNGMFCVAEDVFEGDTTGRPLELTCYRRNLFQISGSITISRGAAYLLLDQSRQLGIYELSASLAATESIDGKSADIICVPWKSGPGNAASSEEKTGSAPIPIPLDLSSNQDEDPMFVTIPIAWNRLQFKVATANNGRRKGLQQHYRIQIALMAKTEDGQLVKLTEIQSNPIVVRGRSPKNFDSSKDVHLSERRAESRARNPSGGAGNTAHWIEPALQQSSGGKYYSQKIVHPQDTNGSGLSPSPPKASASTASAAQRKRPPVPSWDSGDNIPLDDSQTTKLAVGLSFTDEEDSKVPVASSLPLEKIPARASMSSPVETADLLYEYFPLNLDDWMPPVDAIYRPHVVHHLRLLPEVKAQQIRGKPKRYFSADD